MPRSLNLTVEQVAEQLGLSGARVRLLCKQGRLKAKKRGRDWVIASYKRKTGRKKRGKK